MRRLLRPARAASVPVAVALAVLAPLAWHWLAGRTLSWFDTKALYAPLRPLVAGALRAGELPLWNPFAGLGTPVLAEMVHGVLHPVSLLAAFLFPGDGVDPLIGGYVVAATLGAWVLARTTGASPAAASLAGVAYGLSGFVLSMAGNLVFLAGAGSLPLAAAGLWRAARGRPADLLAGGVGVAVCALSGDVQATAVAGMLGLALAAQAHGWRGAVRAAAAGMLGALLAGVQLAPAWAHLGRTDRSMPPDAEFSAWAFDPVRFVELVAPGIMLRPVDGYDPQLYLALGSGEGRLLPFAASVVVGAPILLLATAGGLRRGSARLLAGGAVACLWLAAGHHLGGAHLLRPVPILGGFRFAEKWVGPLTLLLGILAAVGADRLLPDPGAARRWVRVAGATVALALLGSVASALAGPRLGPAGLPGGGLAPRLAVGLAVAAVAAASLAGALQLAARGHRRLAWSALLLLAWLEGAAASGLALRPGAPEARAGVPAAPALVATSGSPAPRVVNTSHFGVVGPPRVPGWDVFDQEAFEGQAISSPDYNVAQRVDNLDVFTGMRSRRWLAWRQAFPLDWALAARRFSVTHLVVPPTGAPPGEGGEGPLVSGGRLVGVDSRTGASIWEVPHRPWVSFAPGVTTASDPTEALETLRQLRAAGDLGAVVESASPWRVAPGRVLGFERSRESLRIEAESATAAVLVVNEAWWPGWTATVDGFETPMAPADGWVRAVAWPAGRHLLVMHYRPVEIRVGLWLTSLGLVIALALAIAAGRGALGGAAGATPRPADGSGST